MLPTFGGNISDYLGGQLAGGREQEINRALGFDAARSNYDFQANGNIYRIENNNNGTRSVRQVGTVADRLAQEQAQKRQAFNTKLQGEESAFLDRFRTEYPELLTGIEQQLGLPQLRKQAFSQQQLLEDLPTALTGTGRGASVNQDRLTRAIGLATSKQAPIAQKAISQAQFGEEEFGRRAQRELVPFQTEIDLMKDRFAREATGFNQDAQAQLDTLLQKMQLEGQLSIAEMQNATKLAELEQQNEQFKSSINPVDLGDRIALLNPSGAEVGSLAKGLTPSRGSGSGGVDITKFLPNSNSLSTLTPSQSQSSGAKFNILNPIIRAAYGF